MVPISIKHLGIASGTLFLLLTSCYQAEHYQQITHQEFLSTHSYNIGQTSLTLIDAIRDRPLKVEVWYPTRDTTKSNITSEYPFKLPPTSRDAAFPTKKHPLILLSHGTGGNRIALMWLACELVGNGYVVASVDHFGNTLDNKIAENFVKIWDRPLDISFVIDELTTNAKWTAIIDSTSIGMAGFSLGGYTAIGLAGGVIDYKLLKEFSQTKEGKNEFNLPELGDISELITAEIISEGNTQVKLKDPRISAFVAMAPALGQGFSNPQQFANVNSPIFIIGAPYDRRTPVNTNARYYASLIPNSTYKELSERAGHYIFMNVAKQELRRNAPRIFKDDRSVARASIHQQVSKDILEFFDHELNTKSAIAW